METAAPHNRQRIGRLPRVVRAALWLPVLGVAVLAAVWWAAGPVKPDAFYEPPTQRPTQPGTLMRSEPFTRAVPRNAQAWRILYTTTRTDDSSAVASAIVMIPASASTEPRPVIAWAHGTTGIAPGCAPSLMLHPLTNVPAVDGVISEGWAVVATDYVGLGTAGGHAYLIGDDAARAVLDAVRAARQLPGLSLDNRVVVWGHSQGGNAALWVGMRGAGYAADINLTGIAALAPASDLRELVAAGRSLMFGKIVSAYLLRAYSAAYPDVKIEDYLLGRASLFAKDIAARCTGEWPTLVSLRETAFLPAGGIFSRDPRSGALGARLLQNTPHEPIGRAPVFIAQGEVDDIVLPEIQGRFVAALCAAGQAIDYRVYAGRNHISLLAADSPLSIDLIAWTRDRLAGRPVTATCRPHG